MKNFLHFGLSLYAILGIAAIILVNFLFHSYSKNLNLISPIPDFLTYFKNNQVSTIDLWFPNNNPNSQPFTITATSGIAYDLTTNKVLFSKNPEEKLPMASLTKIMTAIIALENKKTNNQYVVSKSALVGEAVMGLSVNEILPLNDLLYGLILNSGNDAAETLADNYPGGREAFIKAMNDKVKALGLSNTNFTNPSGLEGDGLQYTTAYDLLVITKYALEKFPTFNQVVSTFNHTIEQTSTHKAFYLENETNLISSYPGVKGVKTGYTPEAGLCLVTYLDYKGHQIIGILLNSSNRRQEMKDLLDNALKSQNITPPPHT